jgi:ferredoxin
VRIEPLGRTFPSPPDQSLLEAATRAAIALPRSCRNGTCRTCLCKLVAGRVAYRIEWPGLTREEKNEGLILPCVAIAQTDLIIEVPDATAI